MYKNFKDKKQEEYYKRTKDFLFSDKKILVNPGGIGLGKTWATIKALKESPIEFSFTAVPTAPAKNIWAEEMNNLGLKNKYAIWFSKSSCCIKKIEDSYFNLDKECKDDCEYWKNLQKDGEYTLKAEEELYKLENYLPTFPVKYYLKNGNESCLMPLCRYGLKKRKYLIGDYFGFLNKNMFDAVINSREQLNKIKSNGELIIDEAHLLPERTKDFLSKTINFSKTINKIKEEIQCDYINTNILLRFKWESTLNKLDKINTLVINRSKKNEERYNLNNFITDYESIEIDKCFTFSEFRIALMNLVKEGYKVNPDGYSNDEELYCFKLHKFLEEWENKIGDPSYKNYFQYKNTTKKDVRFIIDCCDTSKYLKNIFREWNKVILNSGTIPDREYFNYQTGINSFGNSVQYENLIESYSVRDNVIIYSNGNFTSPQREKTYKEIKDNLNTILDKLNGRTIIYIQSKKDSNKLKEIINNKNKIIDFCSRDDGFSTSQQDWLILEEEFNQTKESIAIMNINGRVEGFNFLDKETGDTVDNIIILGYPFPRIGLSYEDQKKYYYSLIKDMNIVKKWINYTPVLIRIHQAVCRAKRKKNDTPVIILWDNNFGSKKLAYTYMPDDLRGNVCWKYKEVLHYISKIKNKGEKDATDI